VETVIPEDPPHTKGHLLEIERSMWNAATPGRGGSGDRDGVGQVGARCGAEARGRASPDAEAGHGTDGMGVMVCGGSSFADAANGPERGPTAPAAPAPRRVVLVAPFGNLPTLPARRAQLGERAVDNSGCVGAATTVAGSHFGVAKASPTHMASKAAGATTSADILSNNRPLAGHTHLDVLNKLAGLTADDGKVGDPRRCGRQWLSPHKLPASPSFHDQSNAVLTPASLTSPPKTGSSCCVPASPDSTCLSVNGEDNSGESRPASGSFCSSSDAGSDDDSSNGDAAAGVFGNSSHAAVSPIGGDPSSRRKAPDDFCLGIRWFMRNNKLVVGSFSGWSVADKMGVKHGDILRAVDGVEVLNMAADSEGNHPARELLKGGYGSKCVLHLMRVDAGQVRSMLNRPGSAQGLGEKLTLHDVHVEVPRLIDSRK